MNLTFDYWKQVKELQSEILHIKNENISTVCEFINAAYKSHIHSM